MSQASQDNRPVFGLIAGQGRLPFLVAAGARAAGYRVICVGFREQADPELAGQVDRFYWASLARPGSWIRLLRRSGLEIEDLIEVRPPETATTRYPFVTLDWARQWPCEEVWKARKRL